MLIIGLAGGVASGKSFVACQFQELGSRWLDADALGHEVLLRDEVIERVVKAFGLQVLDDNRQLDRKKIAAVVFGADSNSQQNLEVLEQIVHPPIFELIHARLQQLRDQQVPAVVLDAPVMFKAGWDQVCDRIVFIDAKPEVRLKRALARGWTQEHFAQREASQTPIQVKRQRATDVIDNNCDTESTKQQVIQLWKEWNLSFPNNHEVPTNA